jgi:hypothetical protein
VRCLRTMSQNKRSYHAHNLLETSTAATLGRHAEGRALGSVGGAVRAKVRVRVRVSVMVMVVRVRVRGRGKGRVRGRVTGRVTTLSRWFSKIWSGFGQGQSLEASELNMHRP